MSTIEVTPIKSCLVVRLPGPHRTLSWALVGGGFRVSSAVVWKEVKNRDLGPSVDPKVLLQDALIGVKLANAIGLLTSAPLADYALAIESIGGVKAACVATVGLANALAVGDLPDVNPKQVGTINIMVWISAALTEAAMVEALSIATEARTRAVISADVPSRVSGNTATGTGTDCIVVASPLQDSGEPYAGKHTALGSLIGQVCVRATTESIDKWRKRRARV